MATKIVTYSMDPLSLKKLARLQDWMHEKNKSRLLCHLIDQEYSRQALLRDGDDAA